MSFDEKGTAIFSHDDVDYCYCSIRGCGTEFEGEYDEPGIGAVTVAKGSRYPELNSVEKFRIVRAALVYDTWGRYPVKCTLDM